MVALYSIGWIPLIYVIHLSILDILEAMKRYMAF